MQHIEVGRHIILAPRDKNNTNMTQSDDLRIRHSTQNFNLHSYVPWPKRQVVPFPATPKNHARFVHAYGGYIFLRLQETVDSRLCCTLEQRST
jgi:hypothetical protein